MPTGTYADLLKTGAFLYAAPYGEALPDETSVAYNGAWGGNWQYLGMTNTPTSFAYSMELFKHSVEEHAAPVKARKINEEAMVETVLAEIHPDFMAYAAGLDPSSAVTTTAAGASQKGYDSFTAGGSWTLEDWAVGIEGLRVDSAGNDQPVRIFLHKVNFAFNGALEFSNRSGDPMGIPIQMTTLADVANSGQLWTMHRVTANATS